jgi:hypothetical protein
MEKTELEKLIGKLEARKYGTAVVDRPGRLTLKTKFIISKWASPEDHQSGLPPYDVAVVDGNIGLNLGIQCALDTIGGYTATTWSGATTTALVVGDLTTAESATATECKTSLAATDGTGCLAMCLDASTYPTRATQTLTWQASASATSGNFAWNNFIVTTARSAVTGIPLIRKLSQQGTKVSGQVWQLSVAVTMS